MTEPFSGEKRMTARDKAIVLFDEAHEIERHASNFVPKLSSEEFQELYRCFLFDFVSQLMNFSSVYAFLYTQNYEEHNRWFETFRQKAELRPMPSDEDGTLQILDSLFSDGYRRILILRFLNPIVPMRAIQMAFQLLQLEDDVVVLGPTQTQRLYLLGLKTLHDGFFKDFDPRISRDYDEAVKAACKLDAAPLTVEEWYDVLSIPELERLHKDILRQIKENQPYPRRTREWLMQLEEKYKLSV